MRTTTTDQPPKNVTRLEKEVYASLKMRARFVGISIDELCRRAKIAPSTFSRWVNGHHSGLMFTIGQMDEILTALEAEKFHQLEMRIHDCDLTISGACGEVDIPVLDYIRWIRKELAPDYGKLAELERFLSQREKDIQAESPETKVANGR